MTPSAGEFHYGPGPHCGVVHGAVAILLGGVPGARAAEIYDLLRRGDVTGALEKARDDHEAADLAACVVGAQGARLLTRGRGAAEVATGSGSFRLIARSGLADQQIPDVAAVDLSVDDAEPGDGLPLLSGVVGAAWVRAAAGPAEAADPRAAGGAGAVGWDGAPAGAAGVVPALESPESPSAAVLPSADAVPTSAESVAEAQGPAAPGPRRGGSPSDEHEPAAAVGAGHAEDHGAAGGDHEFGDDDFGDYEETVASLPEPDPAYGGGGRGFGDPAEPGTNGGLIESVPFARPADPPPPPPGVDPFRRNYAAPREFPSADSWARPAPPASPPTAYPGTAFGGYGEETLARPEYDEEDTITSPGGDDDDLTIARADLQGLDFDTPPASGPAPPPAGGAPMVVAKRCVQGHWTVAFRQDCRVCGGPLRAEAETEIPRPSLGVLRVRGTGEAVELDRDVVIGRAPRPRAGASVPPHLLRISDPTNEVSGQHVALVLDYWMVRAIDLGSTNGTEIVHRDGTRELLAADTEASFDIGDQLVLAETIVLDFDPVP